jgi:general L-amino acid transport system permease protein
VISEKGRLIVMGRYPEVEHWRPVIATALMLGVVVISCMPRFWNKALPLVWLVMLTVYFVLMKGGFFGLTEVDTDQWGGLPLTVMLTVISMTLAFPLAIFVALGRRSNMPAIKTLCTLYVELVRGVPLITVLFMASVMFALFLPEGVRIDQLLRAQVAIILFIAAYLAEAVRGGLQAVPKGQYEAAQALGLPYWKMMLLVILPQSLKISIPPIVNSFISVFKDTSLVVIIAIYDFAYAVKKSVETDFSWKKYFIEAFLFSILVYWIFCFAMSKYSQWLERDLARGHH